MSHREAILEKVRGIPAMPTAASKAIALLSDPEVEIRELVDTIEYDQGLTSNVLRLANSAYFAGPHMIGSLRDAMVRLGMNRVFQLVITSAIAPLTRPEVKGYDLPAGQLLEHSIAVAIGTEELARKLGRTVPRFAFTAGLLHDLGKIVLSTFLEVDAGPIVRIAFQNQVSFEQAEARVLGIDHAEAGAALLENWQLPHDIVDAARYHHQPEALGSESFLVDLVHTANLLCLEAGIGMGIDGLNYRVSEEVAVRLKLRPSMAEAVVCGMLTGIEELRKVVGVDAGM